MGWQDHHKRLCERVNAKLEQAITALPKQSSPLQEAMAYSLLNGGKRIRPFLVYATGHMLGVAEEDLDIAAMAVECIHSYSLIHDDLPAMDDDDLRRGLPTCHIAFDEATAILAGDALQSLAFDILANHPAPVNQKRLKLVSLLAKAAGYQGMCGGQAMDLQATDQQINQSQLQRIHQHKTGALITCCVEMACALADDIAPEQQASLSRYSQILGLAFQVQDDILDVTSDTEVLGKPQGSDEAQNKSTYPGLLGLSGAQQYLTQLHQEAVQLLDQIPYNTQLLADFTHYVVNRQH